MGWEYYNWIVRNIINGRYSKRISDTYNMFDNHDRRHSMGEITRKEWQKLNRIQDNERKRLKIELLEEACGLK